MPPRVPLRPSAAAALFLQARQQQTASALLPTRCCGAAAAFYSFSSSPAASAPQSSSTEKPPTRWLSDLRARIGRIITFGASPAQTERAGLVLGAAAREWRELTAGSEGFLVGGRKGLDGQRVAWGEQDAFGHVNNGTYIRWAESARVNWVMDFAVRASSPEDRRAWAELMQPTGVGLIMKSIKCDYKFPVVYPDRISVYHKLAARPSAAATSLHLEALVLSHGHRRVAARLEEDIAVYDYRVPGKVAVPAFMRGLLEGTWAAQEAEVGRARGRIWELLGEVDGLERETWNREGAVEDLGAAAAAAKK